jgi:hypothetical protein
MRWRCICLLSFQVMQHYGEESYRQDHTAVLQTPNNKVGQSSDR